MPAHSDGNSLRTGRGSARQAAAEPHVPFHANPDLFEAGHAENLWVTRIGEFSLAVPPLNKGVGVPPSRAL